MGVVVVASLLALAWGVSSIPTAWLPLVFVCMSMSLGTTMPVVQVTVQMVAGAANLGAASASVQFSRSIGAALGTATVGAVLFAVIAARDPSVTALFTDIVERGAGVLDTLDAAHRAAIGAEIAGAFRAAFVTIAGFGVIGLLLAWSLPVRRL